MALHLSRTFVTVLARRASVESQRKCSTICTCVIKLRVVCHPPPPPPPGAAQLNILCIGTPSGLWITGLQSAQWTATGLSSRASGPRAPCPSTVIRSRPRLIFDTVQVFFTAQQQRVMRCFASDETCFIGRVGVHSICRCCVNKSQHLLAQALPC